MANYGTPDLTGELLDYNVLQFDCGIFEANQQVVFDFPVFDNDKLTIERLVPGDNPVPMVKNVDWAIMSNDIDKKAKGRMLAIDEGFSGSLLNIIIIINAFTDIYTVRISFNQLYPNNVTIPAVDPGEMVEITEEFIVGLALQVGQLNSMVSNRIGTFTAESQIIKIMSPDPDGTDPNNVITAEIHTLDVELGKRFIRPMYGSFFRNSLVCRNDDTDEVLSEGIDYAVIDNDITLTNASNNESGVYRTIKILNGITNASIDYRAYGETISQIAMINMKNVIVSIADFLNTNPLLTSGNLKHTPSFMSLSDEVSALRARLDAL